MTYRDRTNIWDAREGEILSSLVGHDSTVSSVSWSPTGDRLATTDGRLEIRIWDLSSSQQPSQIATGAPIDRIDWAADGTNLQTVSAEDLTVSTWQTNSRELLDEFSPHIGENKHRGHLSPNGKLRAHKCEANDPEDACREIEVRSATTGAVHSRWRANDDRRMLRFAWSPNSEELAIVSRTDDALGVEVWAVDTEQQITPWISKQAPRGYVHYKLPTWSPDGRRVAVVGWGDPGDDGAVFSSSHVHIFDVATAARVLKRPFGNRARFGGETQAIAWSPDGRQLAQGTTQGIVEIIDTVRLQPGVLGKVCNSPIRCLAWHPAGQRLVVAAEDGTVKIIEN